MQRTSAATRHAKKTLQKNAAGAYELMPGDTVLALAGDTMKTLLGSCVAVILTDPRRTVATMCHIVHVGQPNAENAANTAYGICAMEEMFTRLRQIGVTHRYCHAYVYGGGNMFPHLFTQRHVGTSNIDWVLDYLRAHHISVVQQCLGGNGYRKIAWTVGPTEPSVENITTDTGIPNGR
jgi:chemotaxis protein CheD